MGFNGNISSGKRLQFANWKDPPTLIAGRTIPIFRLGHFP